MFSILLKRFQRTVSLAQCQLWASSFHIQDYQCLVEFDLHWEADGVASPDTGESCHGWCCNADSGFYFFQGAVAITYIQPKVLESPWHTAYTPQAPHKCETIQYFFQNNFVYFCILLWISCTKYVYTLPFPMYSCQNALGHLHTKNI